MQNPSFPSPHEDPIQNIPPSGIGEGFMMISPSSSVNAVMHTHHTVNSSCNTSASSDLATLAPDVKGLLDRGCNDGKYIPVPTYCRSTLITSSR